MHHTLCRLAFFAALAGGLRLFAVGQISQFPHVEAFDVVEPPLLPLGWVSTRQRTPGTNDFSTTASVPRSTPNAVVSFDPRVEQALASPILDFSSVRPDRLRFFTRRTSTFTAQVVVEASLDSGATYPLLVGDTLVSTGSTNYVLSDFALPETLGTSPAVRFRWRNLPQTSGTSTSSIRYDDIEITARYTHDLWLARVRFAPLFPVHQDSVTLYATVKNIATEADSNFRVDVFHDINRDSIPQPSELISSAVAVSLLLPGDSVDLVVPAGRFPRGGHLLIVRVWHQPDQYLQNNLMILLLDVGYTAGSLVVNEIMYAPSGTEPEWVEVLNVFTDSVDIKDWAISDEQVTSRHVITTASTIVPSQGYIVLTRDSAALRDIHPGLPSPVINVPSFPTLNNTGDGVVVYDHRGATMDSLRYAPSWGGNTGGRSLERVDPMGPSTAPANWGSSRSVARSTPGRRNSLSRKDHDIRLDTLLISPIAPVVGDSLVLTTKISNRGLQPVQAFDLLIFLDLDRDSIPQPAEQLVVLSQNIPMLPGDSTTVVYITSSPGPGTYMYIAVAGLTIDEDSTNNRGIGSTVVGYPFGTARINEVMYAPSGEPEWLEILNANPDTVDVHQWRVSNRTVATKYVVASQSTKIPPNGLAVVTKDTALLLQRHTVVPGTLLQVPTLPTFLFNNSGDAVVIYDNRTRAIDSMQYLTFWGGTGGRSLERVEATGQSLDSSNWGSSLAPIGSTPGRKNSLTRKDHDLVLASLTFFPSLPVVTDSITLTARTKNRGLQPVTGVSVQFFHDINADSVAQPAELLTTVVSSTILERDDSVDVAARVGFSTAGERRIICRSVYAMDEDSTNNVRYGRVIVGHEPGSIRANEIMYAPSGGFPEWIELLNVSPDSVNMRQWKIGNRVSSSRYIITQSTLLLPPAGYLVVAKDTALLRVAFPNAQPLLHQVSALPTFLWNNTADAVVVLDDRGVVMDSAFYASGWGGTSGVSLERIDPLGPSTDSTNWSSSVDSSRATPGRANSVLLADLDLRIVRASATGDSVVLIEVVVQNVGRFTSGPSRLMLYLDADRDSLPDPPELFHESLVQPISPRDSLPVRLEWGGAPSGRNMLMAVVDYSDDQRPANNTWIFAAPVSFSVRSLIVNEIMFAPFSERAEFIELYNPTENPVDVAGWSIFDRPTSSGAVNRFSLGNSSCTVQPGEFFVLSSDSSLLDQFSYLRSLDVRLFRSVNQSSLSLNNDGDDIILTDHSGRIIDSVSFLPSWHNTGVPDRTGRSLEKIHPLLPAADGRNWSTCALPEGGTPGRQNSIYTAARLSASRLSFTPNPFSPDGDGHEDFAVVQYELPFQVGVVSIKIYDVKGRLIRRLVNNEPTGSVGRVVWDGRDDERQKARIGMYIVLLEAIGEGGDVVHASKGVVVLAARL